MSTPDQTQPQQAAPGGAPAPGGQPQAQASPAATLLPLVSDAEEDIVKLATALAQAGATPNAIAALHQMADIIRQIGVSIGQAAHEGGEQHQGDAAPGGAPAPAGGQPQQQAAPAGPPTMNSATQHLHEAMQASAQARSQGGAR